MDLFTQGVQGEPAVGQWQSLFVCALRDSVLEQFFQRGFQSRDASLGPA